MTRSIEERFWEKVIVSGEDDCWEWTASKSFGYGQIYHNGKNRRATHVSLEISTGEPFPYGKVACHHCDNPGCVNPRHLFIGTLSDNTIDGVRKGRIICPQEESAKARRSKTTCKHGHDMTGDNCRVDTRGYRVCKACQRKHDENYRNRRIARQALDATSEK